MPITIKDVMQFFEMSTSDFSKQWKELSAEDKSQIKSGIEDGSLNY